jgi:amidohydrolase
MRVNVPVIYAAPVSTLSTAHLTFMLDWVSGVEFFYGTMKIVKASFEMWRHLLHQQAELSGEEQNTSNFICQCLQSMGCRKIITGVGGYSLVAEYDSGKPGKSVMLRSELDALPIDEGNSLKYSSRTAGVSHKCGHDGHIVILLAVAKWLGEHINDLSGKVYLLFQSGEETGAGAKEVLGDTRFRTMKPDFIYALHNLPGYKLGSIILRRGVFCSASLGMKIYYSGKSSHAGHPEDGISPLAAMQSLVTGLGELTGRGQVTIIHVCLGEEAFGTSPGEGVVMTTLRAESDKDLAKFAGEAAGLAEALAAKHGLKCRIERVEEFAATLNDEQAYNLLEKAAAVSGREIIHEPQVFSWSEDFSFYGKDYRTCFLGLGSGEQHAQLHTPDYDFPDELLAPGRDIYVNIIKEVLES